MLNDLTVGKPTGKILRFSLPLLLSTAIQQLYNIADSVVVGNLDSAAGLAAIGAAYPLTLFFIAVATGSSMGCSVVISQLFGAKKMRDMKSAIFTAIISLAVLGAVMSVLGIVLSGPLMQLLGCDESVFSNARAYLAIYSVGVLPMFVYNTANAVFTGLGDSKRPLYFLILSSLLNIVLDIIAVGPMKLGVVGAAWATTVSQLFAAVLSAGILIARVRALRTAERAAAFDRRLFADMSRIAVPSILQQSCVALSHTIVQTLVNSFGYATMAGYEAASKIHNFAYMSLNTVGIALSSYVAQNYGAKRIDRIREGYRASSIMCFVFTCCIVALIQLIPNQLIGLFVSSAEPDYAEIIHVGKMFLRIVIPDYLLICFVITSGGLLRGLGLVNKFFAVTMLDFTVRVSMCFVLTKVLGSYTGLYWPWYFGTVVDLAVCLFWYRGLCRNGILHLGRPDAKLYPAP